MGNCTEDVLWLSPAGDRGLKYHWNARTTTALAAVQQAHMAINETEQSAAAVSHLHRLGGPDDSFTNTKTPPFRSVVDLHVHACMDLFCCAVYDKSATNRKTGVRALSLLNGAVYRTWKVELIDARMSLKSPVTVDWET